MKRWLVKAGLFLTMLVALLLGVDAYVGHVARRQHRMIGWDVADTLDALKVAHPQATSLFLGDSVSRQLFHPRKDRTPQVVYLTSNQAISVVGQYELLRRALQKYPHIRHVYLFYTPRSWADNLDQIFTHDYFCGYFHNPSLVWEVWKQKHDMDLTGAHLSRMLLPNIMSMNSWINHNQSSFGVPLYLLPKAPRNYVSDLSVQYVKKMRLLCQQRGITLSVLPCPCCETAEAYKPMAFMYDAPIRLYDAGLFNSDGIHLRHENVEAVTAQVRTQFNLPG